MDLNLLFSFADIKGKIIPVLIAILFFGVIILIHEFGHFIFATLEPTGCALARSL